jgi:hypothetical protein
VPKERTQKIELCPYQHVRQIMLPGFSPNSLGTFSGWAEAAAAASGGASSAAAAAPLVQSYEGGDSCPGFGPRSVQVEYRCKQDAVGAIYYSGGAGVDLLDFAEYAICKYRLVVGLREAC